MRGHAYSLRDKPSQIPPSQPPINAKEVDASDGSLTEHTFQEAGSVSSPKDRSPDIDEDPTYRQTLVAVYTLLGLIIPDKFSGQPSRIFESKLKENKRKSTLLPMVIPPLEGLLDRWDFYEKKATGNPQQDQPRITQTSSLN